MIETQIKQIPENEPCPGLRAWKTCTYICFGEDEPDSKIARLCIGKYLTCERYQEHIKQKETGARSQEFDDLVQKSLSPSRTEVFGD